MESITKISEAKLDKASAQPSVKYHPIYRELELATEIGSKELQTIIGGGRRYGMRGAYG